MPTAATVTNVNVRLPKNSDNRPLKIPFVVGFLRGIFFGQAQRYTDADPDPDPDPDPDKDKDKDTHTHAQAHVGGGAKSKVSKSGRKKTNLQSTMTRRLPPGENDKLLGVCQT